MKQFVNIQQSFLNPKVFLKLQIKEDRQPLEISMILRNAKSNRKSMDIINT